MMRMHFGLGRRYLDIQKSQNISHFVKFPFRPFLVGSFSVLSNKFDWWFSFSGINKTKLLIDLQSQPSIHHFYCSYQEYISDECSKFPKFFSSYAVGGDCSGYDDKPSMQHNTQCSWGPGHKELSWVLWV